MDDPILKTCLDVNGRCRTCGREVPARLSDYGSGRCEGSCPRCGTESFYIDVREIRVEDIREMPEAEAIAYIQSVETQDVFEALFRVEIKHGQDRTAVILAMLDQWDLLDFDTHNLYKQVRLEIDELREVLRAEPFKHNNLEPNFCAPEAA